MLFNNELLEKLERLEKLFDRVEDLQNRMYEGFKTDEKALNAILEYLGCDIDQSEKYIVYKKTK